MPEKIKEMFFMYFAQSRGIGKIPITKTILKYA